MKNILVIVLALSSLSLLAEKSGFKREFIAKSTTGIKGGVKIERCRLTIEDFGDDRTYIKVYLAGFNNSFDYYPDVKGDVRYKGLSFEPLTDAVYMDFHSERFTFFSQYSNNHLIYRSRGDLGENFLITKTLMDLEIDPELKIPKSVNIIIYESSHHSDETTFTSAICLF